MSWKGTLVRFHANSGDAVALCGQNAKPCHMQPIVLGPAAEVCPGLAVLMDKPWGVHTAAAIRMGSGFDWKRARSMRGMAVVVGQ